MCDKIYVASWSGGKDSTYMVDELLRRGEPLDDIIFCDTGYEHDIMYEYILKCKNYWEGKYPNVKITLLNWGEGKTIFDKWAEGGWSRGQHKGKTRGFPYPLGMSWCTRELKIYPKDRYVNSTYKGKEVYHYIGIAADEPKRIPADLGNHIYPLFDWGVTEKQATEILVERGLHNPLYNLYTRTGCWMCPKQSEYSLQVLRKNFPDKWRELKRMENMYNEMGAVAPFKNIGIEVIETNLIAKDKSKNKSYLEDEEPLGCFCK